MLDGKIIGRRIKERRILLGMNVDELAEMVGKNRATVYRYENGFIENIPMETFDKLVDALNTNIVYLIGATDDPTPEKVSQEENDNSQEAKKDRLFRARLLYVVNKLSDKEKNYIYQSASFLLNRTQSSSVLPSDRDSSDSQAP